MSSFCLCFNSQWVCVHSQMVRKLQSTPRTCPARADSPVAAIRFWLQLQTPSLIYFLILAITDTLSNASWVFAVKMPLVGHLPSWVLGTLISWSSDTVFCRCPSNHWMPWLWLWSVTFTCTVVFHCLCYQNPTSLQSPASLFLWEAFVGHSQLGLRWYKQALGLPAWFVTWFASTWASLVDQIVKNPPAMQETWVWSLGWEDPLENEMETHSSILAWSIPWTEEPGWLHSTELHRIGHGWRDLAHTYPCSFF